MKIWRLPLSIALLQSFREREIALNRARNPVDDSRLFLPFLSSEALASLQSTGAQSKGSQEQVQHQNAKSTQYRDQPPHSCTQREQKCGDLALLQHSGCNTEKEGKKDVLAEKDFSDGEVITSTRASNPAIFA